MSLLHLHNRPWVVFNPTDKQHRQWYNDFLRRGTWGVCPVRFVMPTGVGNIIDRCNVSIIKYYLDQEFPTLTTESELGT